MPEVGADSDGFVSWHLGPYGVRKNKEWELQWQDMGLSRVPWQGRPEGQIQRGLPTAVPTSDLHKWLGLLHGEVRVKSCGVAGQGLESTWIWEEGIGCMAFPEFVSQAPYLHFRYILPRLSSCHVAHNQNDKAHPLSLYQSN